MLVKWTDGVIFIIILQEALCAPLDGLLVHGKELKAEKLAVTSSYVYR